MASVVASPPATQTAQKSSHPFTCMTCSIAFRSSELQRGHMRSDWHRYNLKRRVASLPPLSSEIFAEKVLSAQATSKAAAEKATFEKHCQACNKTYFSENAFRNHLGSQRHRMMEATQVSNADDASVSSLVTSAISINSEPVAPENIDDPAVTADFQEVISNMRDAKLDEAPVSRRPSRPHHSADVPEAVATPSNAGTVTSTAMPINRCLFCNYDSEDLSASVIHMAKNHGLFIPEQDYLDDLEGLITYLQAKVTENCECISCHKLKNTVPAVQTHMRDKSHCKIAFETEEELLEIGQFYDFRSTYSDDDEEADSDDEPVEGARPRGVKLGAARQSNAEDDAEWEDDEEDIDEASSGSVTPTKRNQRSSATAYEIDGELHLPSGRTAGHRSGARYFRQNLHGYPTEEERQQRLLITQANASSGTPENNNSAALTKWRASKWKEHEAKRVQAISRNNASRGMSGVPARLRRDIRMQEVASRRRFEAEQKRRMWQIQRSRGAASTGAFIL